MNEHKKLDEQIEGVIESNVAGLLAEAEYWRGYRAGLERARTIIKEWAEEQKRKGGEKGSAGGKP